MLDREPYTAGVTALLSLGIDLASQPLKTAAALLEWTEGGSELQLLQANMSDAALLPLARQAQVVAIDAPFGWPLAFVEAVNGAVAFAWPHPPGWPNALRDRLMYRQTERHLIQDGLRPLSASTDKIALPTLRCAGLLQDLGVTDRSGAQGIFEVYPQASLRRWGLVDASGKAGGKRYKADAEARQQIVDALKRQAPWLRISPEQCDLLVGSDHLLDALISALTGLAGARGLVDPIPLEMQDLARVEGWIIHPLGDALREGLSPRQSQRSTN